MHASGPSGGPLPEDRGRRAVRAVVDSGITIRRSELPAKLYEQLVNDLTFTAVERPCFEEAVGAQVTDAKAKNKPDLGALLNRGDTWVVS